MVNNDKFKAYWVSIGCPEIEVEYDPGKWRNSVCGAHNRELPDGVTYRIKYDHHWELRNKWIESDFTLPIEWLDGNGEWIETNPTWVQGIEYRAKVIKPEDFGAVDDDGFILPKDVRDEYERRHQSNQKPVETDPNGTSPHAPGAKLDFGKVRLALIFNDMPRAIKAVAEVGTFGADKYTEGGWISVPDGIKRYTNAMDRHRLDEGISGDIDDQSGLLHAAHLAWNALARLELMIRERDAQKTK